VRRKVFVTADVVFDEQAEADGFGELATDESLVD